MPRRRLIPFLSLLLVGLVAVGCETRTDKEQTGGVEISISDFDGLPLQGDVNANFVSIEELTLTSIANDTFAPTSDLMNVELHSYEVSFTRADTGTRLPPTMVRGIFGVVPVNGTYTINGLPVLDSEALATEPLIDLQPLSGGFDSETAEATIRLNYRLVFFGRTISGDEVRSGPANFTIEMCNGPLPCPIP